VSEGTIFMHIRKEDRKRDRQFITIEEGEASVNLQNYPRRCTMTRFLGVYRYKNGFGGGIWFGKRKKRSTGDMNSNLIINAISEFETKYEDDED
jgi:hypothetical protein